MHMGAGGGEKNGTFLVTAGQVVRSGWRVYGGLKLKTTRSVDSLKVRNEKERRFLKNASSSIALSLNSRKRAEVRKAATGTGLELRRSEYQVWKCQI